jgi:hypothetical protein
MILRHDQANRTIRRMKTMFKVIAVSILALTVIGAAGVAMYDNATADKAQAHNGPVASQAAVENVAQGNQAPHLATQGNSGTGDPQQVAQVGEPWTARGTITGLDDVGFDLALDGGGETIYVELGPTTYWQSQGVSLSAGEHVAAEGFAQDGLYHAAVVTKSDGSQITVRDLTSGQPLWSGGTLNGQAQAGNGLQDGSRTPQPQAQVSPEEWITVEGTVIAVAQNSLTIQTADGATLTLQLGQAGFTAQQGVAFAAGDLVRVIGYDQNGRFRAGEIDNLTQGGRLMLLDPNGRPLWAGLGSSGNGGQGGNGNGNAGGDSNGSGNGNNAGAGGNAANGRGNGNGYRGGR